MQLTKWFSRLFNRLNLMGKLIHLYRIKKVKQVIKKLHEINKIPNSGGRIINYLRKINPYVFEELVLTVIENSNIHVIRNKRYSGDGGIDGIFKIKQGKVLVQCKRYGGYINNKDVIELTRLVKEKKYYFGIFVHTGKTGDKSKATIKLEKNVIFISGSLLVSLILGELKIDSHIEKKLIGC
ncbi:restriction endonuclease [archaeon]|nr:restriction endonuclease [archaeon]